LTRSTVGFFEYEQPVEGLPHLFNSGSHKINTERLRHNAVKQAIVLMRAHFHDPLTLPEIASVVQQSPFHFNRIFRRITGIPPNMYLAALRIEQAKKLLLTTRLSVTSICFDVGYTSLGTFTTRFTQFVGMTPTQLRQFSKSEKFQALFQREDFLEKEQTLCKSQMGKSTIEGRVSVGQPFDGLIFIGVFVDPIPQGIPISCTVLAGAGNYILHSIPAGKYYLFAAALQRSENLIDLLQAKFSHRCVNQYPLSILPDSRQTAVELVLSPMHWTDVPILITLPWLLVSHFGA
jgi:AraC family transcriptional regulator